MKKSFKSHLQKVFEESSNRNTKNFRFRKELELSAKIRTDGTRIFGSIENFEEWMQTTNPSFGNRRPSEYLNEPGGKELIENALDALS